MPKDYTVSKLVMFYQMSTAYLEKKEEKKYKIAQKSRINNIAFFIIYQSIFILSFILALI